MLTSHPSRAALLGDLDGDGRVTARDAVHLLSVIAGVEAPTPRDHLLGHLSSTPLRVSLPLNALESNPDPFTPGDAAALLQKAVRLLPPQEVGPLVYTTAGSGKTGTAPAGFRDGPGTQALFGEPYGVAAGPSGNVYVVDRCNSAIRIVAADGSVRTLAGAPPPASGPPRGGFADGPGDQARFNYPEAIAVGPDESVYVADTLNQRIRRILPDGTVSTVAGTGRRGFLDGPAADAQLDEPRAVAVRPSGEVVFADSSNRVRAVGTDGAIRTIAGATSPGFSDGPALEARLNGPRGLAFAPNGDLYIADCHNGAVRVLTRGGMLRTVAGTGRFGAEDGPGGAAQFTAPMGLTVDARGDLWVADWAAETLRRITPDGQVTTVAGAAFQPGLVDSLARSARFYSPMGLSAGPDGRIWIADTDNQRIRVIDLR